MSDIVDIQAALAAAFDDVVDVHDPVSPIIPAELKARSGHIAPAEAGWFSTSGDGATFARPTITNELVLVAPAFDWPRRQAWLQEQVQAVAEFARTTAVKIDGRSFPKMTTATIGLVDSAKGLLGVRCVLAPIQLPRSV